MDDVGDRDSTVAGERVFGDWIGLWGAKPAQLRVQRVKIGQRFIPED